MATPKSESYSPTFLKFVLGFVYFYFGLLKFFPDLSPAEMLASQTVMKLSSGILDATAALFVLAIMECLIGLGFLFDKFRPAVVILYFFHMIGTFTPLFVFPELMFKIAPFAPTIEGQYVLKNLVFVAAGWTVLFPNLFGTRLHAEDKAPEAQENRIEGPVPSPRPDAPIDGQMSQIPNDVPIDQTDSPSLAPRRAQE